MYYKVFKVKWKTIGTSDLSLTEGCDKEMNKNELGNPQTQ